MYNDLCNFSFVSFLSILFSDIWHALNQKLRVFGRFLSLFGNDKLVWDLSNNGSLSRILKSLINQNGMVNTGTTKIPVTYPSSFLLKTWGIQVNGRNANKYSCCHWKKKLSWPQPQASRSGVWNRNAQRSHLILM